RTDCAEFGVETLLVQLGGLLQLTCAESPVCAEGWMFSTLMTPAMFTAAVALEPKLTPEPPVLSVFFGGAAAPPEASGVSVIARGPVALESPEGVVPPLTMLCDLPAVAPGSVSVIGPEIPFESVSSLLFVWSLVHSWKTLADVWLQT